jgi:hypothetical protein
MRELALESRAALDLPQHAAAGSHAVLMLQLFALTVMVLPSDAVIEAIGATGYLAALIGMFIFAVYLAASLFGLHNPLRHRHPIRSLLCMLWLAALASYVLMDRTALDVTAVAGADRMLMQLAVVTGVALIAAECLRSLHDVRRVLRTLCWGGAFCGVVAALQYWTSLDIAPYLRELPGFSLNFDNPGIIDRAALNRVSGTAIHPIELGVVAGMLLPLSIYLRHRPGCEEPLGARCADRDRDLDLGVSISHPRRRSRAPRACRPDAEPAAACRPRRGAVCGRRGLHVGARTDQHPWLVLRGGHERPVGRHAGE